MKNFLKNVNLGSALLAGLFAVVTTALGAVAQKRDIEEALDKRLNQTDADEDCCEDVEEES